MPRTPRHQQLPPWAVVHATARGVERRPIVLDRLDALFFLAQLGDVVRRFDWTVHAFCLMPNHYHLLVEASRDDLSAGFHRLNTLYAQRFNRRYTRWGHLFGERFWSGPIESDEQLANTARYIVFNPVRAGLCEHPREWPWLGLAPRYGDDTAAAAVTGALEKAANLVPIDREADHAASAVDLVDDVGGDEPPAAREEAAAHGERVRHVRCGPVHRTLDRPDDPPAPVGDEIPGGAAEVVGDGAHGRDVIPRLKRISRRPRKEFVNARRGVAATSV